MKSLQRGCVVAALAALVPGLSFAADVVINDAKIAGGKLVVTGKTASGNMNLKLDEQFTAKSNASKAFTFSVVYLPPDCIVSVGKAGAAVITQAVVANCAARGLNAQGAWRATDSYIENDVVTHLGSAWRALKDSKNKAPGVAGSVFWEKFAAKGDPGLKGKDGVNGTNGNDGANGADGAPGAAGEKGDKGDAGSTGPSGVVSIHRFGGMPDSVLPGPGWQFFSRAPDRPSVTVATGQRVTVSITASIGSGSASGGVVMLTYGVCSEAAGLISSPRVQRVPPLGSPLSVSVTIDSLGAGTHVLGLCGTHTGPSNPGAVDDTEISGWAIVTNEPVSAF